MSFDYYLVIQNYRLFFSEVYKIVIWNEVGKIGLEYVVDKVGDPMAFAMVAIFSIIFILIYYWMVL